MNNCCLYRFRGIHDSAFPHSTTSCIRLGKGIRAVSRDIRSRGSVKKDKIQKSPSLFFIYFIYCLTLFKSIPNKYHYSINSTEEEDDRYHSPPFITVQLLMNSTQNMMCHMLPVTLLVCRVMVSPASSLWYTARPPVERTSPLPPLL